jgi:hypothetical protein
MIGPRGVRQWMISGIMLAVLAWGATLAAGAVLFDFDWRKGLIVYGFTAAFLIFWGVMLALRELRQRDGPATKGK